MQGDYGKLIVQMEKIKSFQVLCVTMHQKDFSKIEKMNIQSDIVYANQGDSTWCMETDFHGHHAMMVTTTTRGSGNNRNIALMHATADICLLSDDDVLYYDDYEAKVLEVFNRHPDADMVIFNLDSNSGERSIARITAERKMCFWDRNPYGSVRVAFRLNSQRKYNIWFSNLLGAGSRYGSGEDTLFIDDFRKKGNVYLCNEIIGKVDFSSSTWFSGYDEKYFFNQGAKIAAIRPRTRWLFFIYYALKMKSEKVSCIEKLKLMHQGLADYLGL